MQNQNEFLRLKALSEYDILDTLPEAEYDNIAIIASQICKTPVAHISFIDGDRQWFKSKIGFDVPEVPRQIAFCNYLIEHPNEEQLLVNAAKSDERFKNNPLTDLEKPVIFCASVPIRNAAKQILGSLCVIDHIPREISREQFVSLRVLADSILEKMETKKLRLRGQHRSREHLLLQNAVHASSDQFFVIHPQTLRLVGFNKTVENELGFAADELNDMRITDITPHYGCRQWQQKFNNCLPTIQQAILKRFIKTKHGGLIDVQTRLACFNHSEGNQLIIVSARDVTLQNKTQAALVESEKKFRNLFRVSAQRGFNNREQWCDKHNKPCLFRPAWLHAGRTPRHIRQGLVPLA